MPFNPDEYLASSGSSFNPDDYLSGGGLTPEQKKKEVDRINQETADKKAKINQDYRNAHPVTEAIRDFGQGGTSFARNAINKLTPLTIHGDPLADKNSTAYEVGQLADPSLGFIGNKIGAGVEAIKKVANSPILKGALTGGGTGLVAGTLGEGDSTTGAGAGAAIGTAFGAGIPIVGKLIGKGVDLLSGKMTDIRVRNILKAVGLDSPDAIKALQDAHPDLNVAQVVNDATKNSNALAALQAYAKFYNGQQASNLANFQKAARQGTMNTLAGGNSSEASLLARDDALSKLNQDTLNLRETALRRANLMNEQKAKLDPQIAQAKIDAEIAANRAGLNTPGGRPSSKSFTEPTVEEQKLISEDRNNFIQNAQDKLDDLTKKGFRPLTSKDLLQHIDDKLGTPGEGVSGTNQVNLLQGVKNMVIKTMGEGGTLNSRDLYTIRKEGVGDVIEMLSQGDVNVASKLKASGAAIKIKEIIDEMFEQSGGDLKNYLTAFSTGMRKIDKMEMANHLARSSDDEISNIVKGGDTDLVEKFLGIPSRASGLKKGFMSQMEDEGKPFMRIANEIDRDAAIAARIPDGLYEMNKAIKKGTFSHTIPNLLNPKVATANYVIKGLDKYFNQKTIDRLSSVMYNPKEVLKVIETLPFHERNAAMKEFMNSQNIGTVSGMLTGVNQ